MQVFGGKVAAGPGRMGGRWEAGSRLELRTKATE